MNDRTGGFDPDPLHAAQLESGAWDAGYERGVRDSIPPLWALILAAVTAAILGALIGFTVANAASPESVDPVAGSQVVRPTPGMLHPFRDVPDPAAAAPVLGGGGIASVPIRGTATWYCCTRGYRGTAVVAMPGARYVPAGHEPWGWAAVCVVQGGRSACGTFPVVDACGCPGDRIVDLSIEAVRELGLDPRRGVWPAQLELLGSPARPTTPATDAKP